MATRALDLEPLRRRLSGEVSAAPAERRLYAQDASPYRVVPAAVAHPRDADDCAALVDFARSTGVALIPRGAGTGLAGQCVGSGIVVDCSRHMTAVPAIDPDGRCVVVEPGITASRLDVALARHGLELGPDPSTTDRATLGGMIATNAWGPHAPVDGTMRDRVVALEAVLADGGRAPVGAAEGERGQALAELVERYRGPIGAAFPRPGSGLCCNSGYALHALCPDAGGPPDEARLFAGAEGTLGLITAATLRVRRRRRARRLLCPHFARLADALAAVPGALGAGACTVELVDRGILALTRDHPGQAANRAWVEGDPAAVLLIEFADGGEPGELAGALRDGGAYAAPELTGDDLERAWAVRRAGLGLLMGSTADRRPTTGLEDTAVAVDRLAAYVADVDRLLAEAGTDAVRYGSVSMGLVHLRPYLDLADRADRARYRDLLDGLAALVRDYRGVWSAKHGDGRLRAPWLGAVYGREVAEAMAAVKALYDPDGLLNPGKIVDAPDPLSDLRATRLQGDGGPARLDWSADRDLVRAAGRCHGAGACRQAAAEGGMCPSFQATRDERHGTRGRANLFQQAFEAADPAAALAGDELHEALTLCLGCKACQHECPARVDMARLKVEHLARRHGARGMPWSTRAVAAFPSLSAAGARAPRLANAIAARPLVQRVLGLARPPPRLATEPLPRWLRRNPLPAGDAGEIVLVQDPHAAWYEPGIARAAIAVAGALGYRVRVTACVSAGRAAISQGALARARHDLTRLAAAVEASGDPASPVIGLEPSELLTLRDEAAAVAGPALAARLEPIAQRALLFEEWLAGPAATALDAAAAAAPGRDGRVAVHVHCHARALADAGAVERALCRLPGTDVQALPAGCCGMAGSFGYARSTASVARAVAEMRLAPAVRALDDDRTVVAHGVSCRQQIAALTGRRPCHPAQVVAAVLGLEY